MGLGEEIVEDEFFGLWQGFAGDHPGPHGGEIDEAGLNHCGLLEVFDGEVVIVVFVAMMGSGLVVEWVLDELKAGDAHRVEAQVVGRTRVMEGYRGRAEIPKRREPLAENTCGRVIALRKDAPDPAGAVVEIVVGGYSGGFRL